MKSKKERQPGTAVCGHVKAHGTLNPGFELRHQLVVFCVAVAHCVLAYNQAYTVGPTASGRLNLTNTLDEVKSLTSVEL